VQCGPDRLFGDERLSWSDVRARPVVAAIATALGCAALIAGGLRIRQLERGELEYESEWHSLDALASAPGSSPVSARLAGLSLRRGERALFEVCWRGEVSPADLGEGLEFVVLEQQPALRLMLRVTLDRERLASVARDRHAACLRLGEGWVERSARYSVDAVWPGGSPSARLRALPLQARILARTPLTVVDRVSVLALALAILLGLWIALWAKLPSRLHRNAGDASTANGSDSEAPVQRDGVGRRVAWAVFACAALAGAAELPVAGASFGWLKGIGLAALQVGLALALGGADWPSGRSEALALQPASRPGRAMATALLAAALLVVAAELALRGVPATSRAPIQSFVSWPSGLLCFALLGVLLPLGEELFFRGYLYGRMLAFGRTLAFAISVAIFLALHLRQSWGNWGGAVAVAVAGVVLTALRARTGSTLVPAIAHVIYNATLSAVALWP
jgi:membrane protease YdiL (CAAX protease family)